MSLKIIKELFIDWRSKIHSGVPKPGVEPLHESTFKDMFMKRVKNLSESEKKRIVNEVVLFLEKTDDEKYKSISFGRYKLKTDIGPDGKGKEGTPTFKRDGEGNYVEIGKDGDDDKKDDAPEIKKNANANYAEPGEERDDSQSSVDGSHLTDEKPEEKSKSDNENQSKKGEKDKELDDNAVIETSANFNEGKFSEDGVSDDDFGSNTKIKPVVNEVSIEDIKKYISEPVKFPKKYLKVLHRMLNTKKAGGIKISDFTDAAGGGTLESTAGEIMTMIVCTIDDDEQANQLLDLF